MKHATVEIEGNWWSIMPAKRKEMESPEYDGQCDLENQVIQVYERLPFHEAIETVIHEVMHAQQPDMREQYVRRRARELTRALIKTGLIRQEAKRKRNAGS